MHTLLQGFSRILEIRTVDDVSFERGSLISTPFGENKFSACGSSGEIRATGASPLSVKPGLRPHFYGDAAEDFVANSSWNF
jgi:hypothetical protein